MADTPMIPKITGRELVDQITAHPQWLDLPVHLLADAEQNYLTAVECDCFDPDEGPVLPLVAQSMDELERERGDRG